MKYKELLEESIKFIDNVIEEVEQAIYANRDNPRISKENIKELEKDIEWLKEKKKIYEWLLS